jgi:hypothetical protein
MGRCKKDCQIGSLGNQNAEGYPGSSPAIEHTKGFDSGKFVMRQSALQDEPMTHSTLQHRLGTQGPVVNGRVH